jgi:two-component system, NarL family, nitrate/nitrite response regulator NarL
MIKVLLLDDHLMFLDSFKTTLNCEGSFNVVAESSTARGALQLAEQKSPDLLVVDLMLTDGDGISFTRELSRRGISAPVMLLTMHRNWLFVRDALDNGVRGYALKDQPLTEILQAMRVVAGHGQYLAPALEPILDPAFFHPDGQSSSQALDQLTHREREVFFRIIDGANSRDIARSLSISLKTIETHRTRINRKLGVHSPAQLIRLAALMGLLPRNTSRDLEDVPAVPTQPGVQAAPPPGNGTM